MDNGDKRKKYQTVYKRKINLCIDQSETCNAFCKTRKTV